MAIQAMGFPHDKTTHHFRLYSDGGAIEVTANEAKDSQDIQAIQSHLKHIVAMFFQGNFSIPMFVHNLVPPGVSAMKERRGDISYSFEVLTAGGKVRIRTTDPDALKAIHEFLRFQINDHHTGGFPRHRALVKSVRISADRIKTSGLARTF